MEPRFASDLGDVRVHTSGPAEASARQLNSLAFTLGRDVAFAPGQYSPNTNKGRQLLAHELTHVLQQRDGSAATMNQKQNAKEAAGEPARQDVPAAAPAARPDPLKVEKDSGIGVAAAQPT